MGAVAGSVASSTRFLAAAAVAVIGIAASAAALVDVIGPAPAFCADDGCGEVRGTAWATPLGVPLPVIGVAFFAAALAATLAGADRLRRALALAGAAGALGLVALQAFVIGAWCPLCLVADGAALAFAALALPPPRWPRARRGLAGAAALAGIAAVAAPLALAPGAPAATRVGLVPEVVAREQVPGEVVIVDFVDFECPFCRAFHGRLVEAVRRAEVPVRVVRKMVPLSMHPGAMPAAIAYCSAERQGKGDAMAEALLAAPVAALTEEGCERIAAALGLDLARFRADRADPAIRARIDADLAAARAAGIRSLPTIYVGERAFVGAGATVDELVAALRAAATMG